MRVLIVTKIFPNSVEPLSSPFNRLQFAELSRLCEVELLATIPWFPGASAFGRWSAAGRLTRVPARERIDGLAVRHPRFVFLPKLWSGMAGPLYAASLAPLVLPYHGRIDVVLGAWAYPDGFAAVVIAGLLGVPAVVKLHGSDMNVVAGWAGPKERLRWALPRAERVVAVSAPLAEQARALGVAAERVDVVPNGIDRQRFRPRDRLEARRKLGLPLDRRLVLYLGHLSEKKGAFEVLRAFHERRAALAGAQLLMLGDGQQAERCRALARTLQVPALFPGAQPHDAVPEWLAACDLLALPSWNEGMPNVVVEALASGRPVVASSVGGIPELVKEGLGELVPPREPALLGDAMVRVLSQRYDPELIAARLTRPDWRGSAHLLHASLLRALAGSASEAA